MLTTQLIAGYAAFVATAHVVWVIIKARTKVSVHVEYRSWEGRPDPHRIHQIAVIIINHSSHSIYIQAIGFDFADHLRFEYTYPPRSAEYSYPGLGDDRRVPPKDNREVLFETDDLIKEVGKKIINKVYVIDAEDNMYEYKIPKRDRNMLIT